MATTIIGLGIDPNKPKGEHEAEPRLEVVRQGIVPLPKPEQPNEPAQMPKVIVDLTDDSPAKRRARRKWQTYDDIGLPPPELEPAKHHDDAGPAPSYIHKVASKLVVSTYRLMGFAILTIIVVALVSYIASTLFYYGSHSWMVPTAISTSDEKVVQMRSELAAQQNNRDALTANLQRVDSIIAGLKKSAYLRALDDGAQVAMVPYSNVEKAHKGAPLYACKVGMFVCHQVGTVAEVLPSEVQVESPHGGKTSRGLMVEMKLTDPDAAREDVLFAGGKPLGL